MDIISSVLIIVVAYFLGSIPFGLLFTKMAGLGDVRNIGSGNIGATNVLRTGNKKLAAATLFADVLKGIIAVLTAKLSGFSEWTISLAAIASVLGHIFPVWLKFKGGKGVATALAVYWIAYWPLGAFACITWILMFFFARISALSSISAMLFAPIIAFFFASSGVFALSIIIGGVVILRHRDNIIRIMQGTEISLK